MFRRRQSRAFAWMSVVLLVLLAIAPAKDFLADWHVYQRGYERLISKRSDAVTLRRHFEPGIQQIWLPEMGVVDRCTTCHSALKEASAGGHDDSAVSLSPGDSAQAGRNGLLSVPSRTRHSDIGCRRSSEHAGMGRAAATGEIPGVFVRPVSPAGSERHAAVESGPEDAQRLRMRALPHR
jgi:hypothetical protein